MTRLPVRVSGPEPRSPRSCLGAAPEHRAVMLGLAGPQRSRQCVCTGISRSCGVGAGCGLRHPPKAFGCPLGFQRRAGLRGLLGGPGRALGVRVLGLPHPGTENVGPGPAVAEPAQPHRPGWEWLFKGGVILLPPSPLAAPGTQAELPWKPSSDTPLPILPFLCRTSCLGVPGPFPHRC